MARRKPFKRYYTGSARQGPGKGSDRREAAISDEEFAANWCATFGCPSPKDKDNGPCPVCGRPRV